VQYIEAWLRGRGAAPIYNLMEDAATAEISRAQIWQWLKYGAVLENGVKVTPEQVGGEESAAAPMRRFDAMIDNMDGSFLITKSWKTVQKRI